MYFYLDGIENISEDEYKMFLEFYHKYNDKIRKLTNKTGCKFVRYSRDDGRDYEEYDVEDLTPILEILKTLVDKNKKIEMKLF